MNKKVEVYKGEEGYGVVIGCASYYHDNLTSVIERLQHTFPDEKKVEKRSPLEEWRDNKFSNLSDLEEELINQTANWLVDTLVGKPLYPYLAKDVASIKSFQAGINAVLDEAKRLIGRV